jgi:hypothetical protein
MMEPGAGSAQAASVDAPTQSLKPVQNKQKLFTKTATMLATRINK